MFYFLVLVDRDSNGFLGSWRDLELVRHGVVNLDLIWNGRFGTVMCIYIEYWMVCIVVLVH